MEKRTWSSQEKLRIVLEGLSGQIEISKLCALVQISSTLFYRWRDQLLKFGHQSFDQKIISKKEQFLETENHKLKRIIGELTVELKKNECEL